ncbi:hypothetical protein [Dongia sedimenti]|uniref:RNA-directed DNA polymerase n=1 Tax=Dongia sedimenti TaxID=3064282 RepID=A0ABU0YU98_9PROT|nr:hypothetical protein [Rhodospirillaceae bacterium R-7]
MRTQRHTSWSDVDLSDLLGAFRKAKADCFFERSTYCAEQFSNYEQKLFSNLEELLSELHEGRIANVFVEALGRPRIFAKCLGAKPRANGTPQCFFSDDRRAFERLQDTHDLTPEFRLVGDFGVEMHVLSGLWINLIGHRYDARLRGHSFGSRVRRFGRTGLRERPTGDYQYDAVGSFEPYFQPYRAWRDRGIEAIRSALDGDEPVVALTLDFSSYYHNVDPSFVVDPAFLTTIGLELNQWEIEFTQAFVVALQAWGKEASKLIGAGARRSQDQLGGLPIGLAAVRIITNVLLYEFDERILDALAPVYYGRYVDDVFLVIRDSGRIRSATELWDFIKQRAGDIFLDVETRREVEVRLPGGYQARSRLTLKQEKQKVFFLRGQSGRDLLNNIAHQVNTLSSERRLMPLAEEMDTMASARALAAATGTAEEPDSLRRADGLTLRRLGWALQLRSAEILARDLDRKVWAEERKRFYDFACAHILRPDKILEHVDGLARLISLAVSLADWSDASMMYRKATSALRTLESNLRNGNCKINGQDRKLTARVWDGLREWVQGACREAVLRSIAYDPRRRVRPSRAAHDLLTQLRIDYLVDSLLRVVLELRETDWAKRPYREHLRVDADRERPAIAGEEVLPEVFEHYAKLSEFLERSRHVEPTSGVRRVNPAALESDLNSKPSLLPYILATRPYSAQDIALYRPDECIFGAGDVPPAQAWAHYCRAIRGAPQSAPDSAGDRPLPSRTKGRLVDLTGAATGRSVHLGITSLETSQATWALAADGKPDRSAERYRRLATIVNLAVQATPRPTHLLLPELSVPEAWLDTISAVLLEAGISLIAGLDYDLHGRDRIGSSAVLVLRDDRLGFKTAVQIRQPKLQAAPGEEEHLLQSYGRTWVDSGGRSLHPVYVHEGLHFGVLICSELQNIDHRQSFQGDVDLLAVLSWNQDLETFSALVEAACLDVHAYVALVNNRAYGDSRVRAPRKDAHARDICRIRGGKNDHLVVVEINPTLLRAQQSRVRRWPKPNDRYKPAPEGFKISNGRRITPN